MINKKEQKNGVIHNVLRSQNDPGAICLHMELLPPESFSFFLFSFLKVSAEDVSREAVDMEMEKLKYVEELKKALVTATLPASKYNFDLVQDGDAYDTYCFTYEKKLKDVSVSSTFNC